MSYQVKGIVHKIFPTESKTDTFQAREFVIKTQEQYPQFIKFQLVQERCQAVDPYNEGDEINVHFDLRGREWNDKYFTNLNAWRIEGVTKEAAPAAPAGDAGFPTEEPPFNQKADLDDLIDGAEEGDFPF